MNYLPKGKVKAGDKVLYDRYGKTLHIGAKVAFIKDREVHIGEIEKVLVLSVKPFSNELDKITFKIEIKNLNFEGKIEIKTFKSIAAI